MLIKWYYRLTHINKCTTNMHHHHAPFQSGLVLSKSVAGDPETK